MADKPSAKQTKTTDEAIPQHKALAMGKPIPNDKKEKPSTGP